MAWDLSDGIKLGVLIATVSGGIAVQKNKIKILFRKTDRHQDMPVSQLAVSYSQMKGRSINVVSFYIHFPRIDNKRDVGQAIIFSRRNTNPTVYFQQVQPAGHSADTKGIGRDHADQKDRQGCDSHSVHTISQYLAGLFACYIDIRRLLVK